MFDIIKQIYLNSIFYDKKISSKVTSELKYKPSAYLLSSIVKIRTKKFNIKNFLYDNFWTNKKLNQKQLQKLSNFYWLFSLDLKSSNESVQMVIKNWIEKNYKYNSKNWDFEITSKRIISWLSNTQLTYDSGINQYQKDFNSTIHKQTFHLINQVDGERKLKNKLRGVAAIILVGLSYKNEKNFTLKGLENLKKIIKYTFDNNGFLKSRNIKSSIFFLKYLILIREWFKESQSEIPNFIDENIFNLGQSYAFFWKNLKFDPLFNGNNNSDNLEFDYYLKRLGYSFKNNDHEFSNYVSLKDKKINLIMDVGPSPNNKFSEEYQAGALSFEFVSSGKKIFTNSGYYDEENIKFQEISKSSAMHNVLVVDDNSSCKFVKNSMSKFEIKDGLKTFRKSISFEKDEWKILASHDGYLKKYNLIYEREIKFFPKINKLVGIDKLHSKKLIPNIKFDIRFHLNPLAKIVKTQDQKSILIEMESEGWRFICDNHKIDIDNGLYFGNKNTHIENQNIFISGITDKKNINIKWVLNKI